MSEEQKAEDSGKAQDKKPEYTPPKGAVKQLSVKAGGRSLEYRAEADWIVLRKDEKPTAEMFYTHYSVEGDDDRPVTFVFNGGPGASSVYLHFGAIGPKRAEFGGGGEPLPPPHRLVDNDETWLRFTDLVFIDPIGTGLSRMVPDDKAEAAKKDQGAAPDARKDVEYWGIKRDLESIGEFVSKFLSRYRRWESPVYLAGESYGGFRVARLARQLQEQYGVALAGAVIISPALEFSLLDASDYDDLPWVDSFATMAGAAAYHGRARKQKPGESIRDYATRASGFAVRELLPVLAAGDFLGRARKDRTLDAAADYIGLPRAVVRAKYGRVTIDYFVKNLLRDKGLVVGLYDASAVVRDPYPDRDHWSGPDPTLHVIERVFAAAINTQLRANIGLETERDYTLSSDEANENWKNDMRKHALESQTGSTDELRYGMSINPHMKVYLTHGVYDLVTPYFAAERIKRLMKLDDERERMLTVRYYEGGHMFYTWDDSRKAFARDMEAFYGA